MHSTQYHQSYDDSALPYRCNTFESGENCRNQTAGSSMARCLSMGNGMSTRHESHERVMSEEAKEYLNRGRSGTMNMSVDGTTVSSKLTKYKNYSHK